MTRRYIIFVILAITLLALDLQFRMGTTPVRAETCPSVTNTSQFSIVYDAVTVDGASVPVGSVVKVSSPETGLLGLV